MPEARKARSLTLSGISWCSDFTQKWKLVNRQGNASLTIEISYMN